MTWVVLTRGASEKCFLVDYILYSAMPSKQYVTSDHSLVNNFYIKACKCSEFHQYSTFIADFTYTLGNLPVSEYFTFNYLPLEFHHHPLTSVALPQPSVRSLRVQPQPLFSQLSCPLLSFSLSLWPSGVLESPRKSHTTARRVLNLSSRLPWPPWSLTSEP